MRLAGNRGWREHRPTSRKLIRVMLSAGRDGAARRIGYADAGSIEKYGIELAMVLAVGDDVATMPVCYDSPYSGG